MHLGDRFENKCSSWLLLLALVICFSGSALAQTRRAEANVLAAQRIRLPNGWSLSPVGKSTPLGDLPLNMVVSPKGRYLAVTNNGQSIQSIQLFDAKTDTQLDNVEIPKSWAGLAFSQDEQYLYASGGDNNCIYRYQIKNQHLFLKDTFLLGAPFPMENISPTGISIDNKRNLLYTVTKLDNQLYIFDIPSHRLVSKVSLKAQAYSCILSKNNKTLYISAWSDKAVLVYDIATAKITRRIPVGDHPNDLCLSNDGHYLYVANANDNTVSVIDLKGRGVVETLNTAVYPTDLSGTTTNSLALSKDNKTLYIANADNNCLAVFDVRRPGASKALGFIPTGWYPSCVRTLGGKIYVTNGKGFSSRANPEGPNPTDKKEKVGIHKGDSHKPLKTQYIGGGLLMGSLSIIPAPSEKLLASYSREVYQNTPFTKEAATLNGIEKGNPIPSMKGEVSPIKHVFYVIKENRTYDQVLGDVREGNGDTSLVLFGDSITPNQHAIVRQFVLLDNFYVDGEVSADGHNWSMGAYATDYMEKNWPTSYGGRGPGPKGKLALNKKYIWDQAAAVGLSYRTYGEFASGKKAKIPVLEEHYVPRYPKFNLNIRDTTRYKIWEHDFDSLVIIHQLPQLMTVYFPNDHTKGMAAGQTTPFAYVADNDLAIGKFLEHLSHSPIWKQSVVFILEDDAQNGPDHVDAHRSTAYIAGGYVKRGFVDHTMYSTSSVLKSIELILGMPPMSQYDAAAVPMWRCFSSEPDTASFTALPANVNLNDKNPKGTILAKMSENLDFSKEDIIPDQLMNTITWKGVKGENAVMPSPVRAAFVKAVHSDQDDDD
ncbi:MAG TPA: beta-propeller fold lactonase family protein [Arachidicoccus sp.]|nr:beta-propeller fold lactonase family protein [Arachidicoccus sp.]